MNWAANKFDISMFDFDLLGREQRMKSHKLLQDARN